MASTVPIVGQEWWRMQKCRKDHPPHLPNVVLSVVLRWDKRISFAQSVARE